MTRAIRKQVQITENKRQTKILIDNVDGLRCTRSERPDALATMSRDALATMPLEGRGFSPAVKVSHNDYNSRSISREPLTCANTGVALNPCADCALNSRGDRMVDVLSCARRAESTVRHNL